MRTNIVIDNELMKKAMSITGHKTKKATVEEGLKLIVSLKEQEKIRAFRGKLKWHGDLEQMRLDK
ncbi:MAG: type II toxin-antitoxin system VapB family antitoxin [Marinilabiliales bacterium]|nr:MAG: type II toxin-antitoxin system VapB family antitoxin [Marinilabiliales bacterium]